MRRVLFIVLSLIPVLALGQPVYDCHRAEGKIKIDGKLKEKAWEAAVPCTEFGDIRGKGHAAPKYLTTMRMLWDYDNLYISAVLEEPDVKALVKDHDDIVYHDNDFEVFLNPFCDEKLYYELETNALGTVMDLLMEKPYRKGGTYIMPWDFKGLQLAVKVHGTLNKSNDVDEGWTVEMSIPFASMKRGGDDPRANKVWRANFSRVEWLTKPEENWVWSPTGVVDIHLPDRWGFIRFIDRDGVVPKLP